MLNENLLRAVVSHSRDGITISDNAKPDNPLMWVNEAFERMTGYPAAEILGKNCRFLQGTDRSQEGVNTVRSAILNAQPCLVTLRNYRKSGTMFWNELSLSPIRNEEGIVTHFLGIQKDVTAQVILSQAIQDENIQLKSSKLMFEHLINIDSLTGLHNRRYLDDQVAIQWKIAMRQGTVLTAFIIDIDYFKEFNDVYGHFRGDEVLKTVALALKSLFQREADVVARYGGEEFVILAIGMDEEQAANYSRKLVHKIEALGITHTGSPIGRVTISLGYHQVIPNPSTNSSQFFEQADQALYKAKGLGRNTAVKFG